MRTRTRTLGIIAAIAITAPLSACVGGEAPPPAIAVESVSVPELLQSSEPLVYVGGGLLPAADGVPLAFGGSITTPGEAARPAVWVSTDTATWRQVDVDSDLEGSFSGTLAGSAELTALGGTTWKDHRYRSVLWTSTDRENWQPVDLPDTFDGTHLLARLAVDGTTVYGIGVSAQGDSAGFAATPDGTSPMSLPALGPGERLYPLTITSDGSGNLLLIARPGPEGEHAPVVTYRSSDGGDTWSGPSPLADSTASISGAVWTGSEYVVTGSAPRSSAAGATYRAASWVSADGAAWSREAVVDPPDDGPFYLYDTADTWLGPPAVVGGVVTAISGNNNSAVSALYTRSASGAWSFNGTTSINETNGETGYAVLHPGSDTVATILGSGGHLRAGAFVGSGYSDVTTFAARDFVATASDAYPDGDSVDIVLRQRSFTVSDNFDWRNSSQHTLARFDGGDAVTVTPWDPEVIGELLTVRMATDATGAQVVTGSRFPPGKQVIVAEGFYRASDDAEWVPMTGFSTSGSTELYAHVGTGSGWVAVGAYRESSISGIPSHAAAWSSVDGVEWSRDTGDFGSGLLESSLNDVCLLPDGTPIGVGWVEVNTGAFSVAAWSPADDSWERLNLGEFGGREGYALACASDEDGVVVSATIADRSVLLHTSTGADWREVFRAEAGSTLADPVAVPGGFAAAGWVATDASIGPAVWLSSDGVKWVPVAVPTLNPATTYLVAPAGEHLLVLLSGSPDEPVVVVRDIAAAIERLAPAPE